MAQKCHIMANEKDCIAYSVGSCITEPILGQISAGFLIGQALLTNEISVFEAWVDVWVHVDLQQLYFFFSISSGSTCLNSTRSSSGSYDSLSASSPFCETVFAIQTNKSSMPEPSLKTFNSLDFLDTRSVTVPRFGTKKIKSYVQIECQLGYII